MECGATIEGRLDRLADPSSQPEAAGKVVNLQFSPAAAAGGTATD
jgi:hypothetical protein